MPEHMKKHPTEQVADVVWHGKHYAVPVTVIEKYRTDPNEKKTFTVDDVFGGIIDLHGEPAALLKGVRAREGLTQVAFAKEIEVTQANLSAMENGRRPIGKELAKRIAKKFDVDYRYFL